MPELVTNEPSYQASGRWRELRSANAQVKQDQKLRIRIINILIALCFILGCTCVQGQNYRSISVRTPDNITIAAQEWGNPKGPEIVFIHGLGQSHLSWKKQYESSLAKEFRILTYDLRGHGDSGKPSEPDMYSEGKRWGDDLRAVISAAGFKKPTLVAWSLGGVVVLNYLHTYGGKDLAGVVFVDAIVGIKPEFLSSNDLFPPLFADDLLERSYAIANFLRACFHKQPDQNDFELMLTYNAMVPVVAHRALRRVTIEGSEESLKSLEHPVLIVQGEKDSLVTKSMALYAHRLLQNSKIKIYSDSGHSPFFEEAARFNQDLHTFVSEIGSRD
jgi:non-heme chloroperoxidase